MLPSGVLMPVNPPTATSAYRQAIRISEVSAELPEIVPLFPPVSPPKYSTLFEYAFIV